MLNSLKQPRNTQKFSRKKFKYQKFSHYISGMKKLSLSLLVLFVFSLKSIAQIEQYGPFVGGTAFVYKSNLYNAQDLHADSVQKYAFTPGFGVSFDFGHKYLNGISISSGISFSTSNQNYKGKDTIIGDVVTFSAKTKMSYLKIPLIFSMQTRNDKKAKAYYSLGVFYSYNTGYSETSTLNYEHNNFYRDQTTTISKKSVTTKYDKDTNSYVSNISERPYQHHGWGAIMALGASKRYSKKGEWFIQTKIEYQISSSENNDEMVFTPAVGSKDTRHVGHVWGNYAKYMHTTLSNYNRSATHPFDLGLSFGIRYYLFDFE